MIWLNKVIKKIETSKKAPFLVSDYKTPSGKIHVGALRGVIIHDIVFKALKEKGKKIKFQYGFDDLDPMDSFPIYLPEKFKKYMGVPLYNIPSPEDGADNFAQYYANEFRKVFNKLGCKPEILWTSELYKSGKLNKAIKIALENADKIRQIYLEVSGSKKSKGWYPFQVICPKCGKIGTTRVFDFKNEKVEFACERLLVGWAKGCGYKGKISPYDGNGKLPWKIEWAAKWFVLETDFEGAGKDHYTKGGSREIAEAAAREIYKIEPPVGVRYEFFLVSGKKMASSKGLGVLASEIAEILPPELLRFLMVRTPVQRPIDFNPEGETIPRLYDFYDEVAEAENLSQVFKYSQVEKPKKAYHMRFSKVAYLLQMPNVDLRKETETEKGAKLTPADLADLEHREEYAQKWLAAYAPEHYKFEVKDKMPAETRDLRQRQREFLAEILKLVEQKDWKGEDLHTKIHEIRQKMDLDPRQAFSAIYLIFIGKDSGPQAGWFLTSLDRDFVIKRLKESQST